MRVIYAQPGQLDVGLVGDDWLLILGGVTRQGNRIARRTASRALESGFDVVWFDGFEETFEGSSERVPLEVRDPKGSLVLVGFAHAEAGTMSGHLRSGGRLRANRFARSIWKLFLRRLGSVLRPRASWLLIRSDIRALARHVAPRAIVYGDDHAITSAWYSGRIWKAVPITTHLPSGGS